jgi:hypothetical protein
MAWSVETSGFFSKRVRLYSVCFLLAACTGLAYWNVDKCGFLSLDDQEYVYENGNVVRGPSINGITWAFTTFQAANYFHALPGPAPAARR